MRKKAVVGCIGGLLLLAACTTSRGTPPASTRRLEVDAEHWPIHLLELAQSTIHLVRERGEPAYLIQISVQLPDVNPPATTGVTFQFYLPKTRKRLNVTYASFSGSGVTLPPDQLEAARKAGVARIFEDAAKAAVAPVFTEQPPPEYDFVPTPLLGVQVDMRDAYQLARKGGLLRANSIELKVSVKNPKVPLVIWSFGGRHDLEDTKQIHVNALTGALVDEDDITAITRAERHAREDADMAMIRAFFARRGHSGWTPPGLTPEAAAVVNGGTGQQQHGIYFDGLHDYTVGPAADCAARGGTNAGPSSFGGSFCY